jgi:thiol-disulfide isomerase/thioredoxin
LKNFGIISLIVFCLSGTIPAFAQLPDCSTVPDFTFTDIKGKSHHLYEYLNEGKSVVLDVSATWCHPCWEYHKSGILDSLYNLMDSPGSNKWKVLFIEADKTTTIADVEGFGFNTVGDWTDGTVFPIMNPDASPELSAFMMGFNINYYPTLIFIYPNKKIFQSALNKVPRASLKKWLSLDTSDCLSAGIDQSQMKIPVKIYPNPACEKIYFELQSSEVDDVIISIMNSTGDIIANEKFMSSAAQSNTFEYDISRFQTGIYFIRAQSKSGEFAMQKIVVSR